MFPVYLIVWLQNWYPQSGTFSPSQIQPEQIISFYSSASTLCIHIFGISNVRAFLDTRRAALGLSSELANAFGISVSSLLKLGISSFLVRTGFHSVSFVAS